MRFDPAYVAQVLADNFEDAKTLFLSPLLAIHHAHLVMLAECGIVPRSDARALRAALDAIPVDAVRCARYDGSCEDLFFYVEGLLAAACGEELAGRLRVARSRNDIDMTMYRMRQREQIESLADAVNDLRSTLLEQASRHLHTVFAAHTHTQPAQPTTVAHYMLAVLEQLERDVRRLRAAYAATNRCPLGACAITGTGFPIDRAATSELLGFAEPTGNTYGSIATVDYLLESLAAVSVFAIGLGRTLQDLLLWCTSEVGYLRLADGFVQTSSIMPQKRNPVALEHARALVSKSVGEAAAVTMMVHNTPFGDVVDTEDDLQPLVAAAFRDARRAAALVSAAIRTAEIDAARMGERAAQGGTTFTELADHLVRSCGLPFAAAHAVAARTLQLTREGAAAGEAAVRAGADVLGRPLSVTAADLEQVLSARHFVEVRSTHGGPAPLEATRAIDDARRQLQRDRDWIAAERTRVAAAAQRLRERSLAL